MSDFVCSIANYLGVGGYLGCAQKPGVKAPAQNKYFNYIEDQYIKANTEEELAQRTYSEDGARVYEYDYNKKLSPQVSVTMVVDPLRVRGIRFIGDEMALSGLFGLLGPEEVREPVKSELKGGKMFYKFEMPYDRDTIDFDGYGASFRARVEIDYVDGSKQLCTWEVSRASTK